MYRKWSCDALDPSSRVSNRDKDCTVAKEEWPHLADLDLLSATHGPVEVLVGTYAIELIVPREVVEGPPGTPCALRTRLGWSVAGRAPRRSMHAARIGRQRQRTLQGLDCDQPGTARTSAHDAPGSSPYDAGVTEPP